MGWNVPVHGATVCSPNGGDACVPPPPMPNGVWQFDPAADGGTATLQCNVGYTPVSAFGGILTCSDGTWSASTQECVQGTAAPCTGPFCNGGSTPPPPPPPLSCSAAPPTAPNGAWVLETRGDDEVATLQCNIGYVVSGDTTPIVCHRGVFGHDTWGPSAATCVQGR